MLESDGWLRKEVETADQCVSPRSMCCVWWLTCCVVTLHCACRCVSRLLLSDGDRYVVVSTFAGCRLSTRVSVLLQQARTHTKKPRKAAFTRLINQADALRVSVPEVAELKKELRVANRWLQEVRREVCIENDRSLSAHA